MPIQLSRHNNLYTCKTCNHAIVAGRKPARCSECGGAMAKVGGKRNKYNAKKTEVDGIVFDSGWEAEYYCQLKLRRRAGEIDTLTIKPEYELQPAFVDSSGKKRRAINYEADFSFFEDGQLVVVDAKGKETEVFRIKKKLFLYKYPQVEFRIEKKKQNRRTAK